MNQKSTFEAESRLLHRKVDFWTFIHQVLGTIQLSLGTAKCEQLFVFAKNAFLKQFISQTKPNFQKLSIQTIFVSSRSVVFRHLFVYGDNSVPRDSEIASYVKMNFNFKTVLSNFKVSRKCETVFDIFSGNCEMNVSHFR
jgi:hypothetical protein